MKDIALVGVDGFIGRSLYTHLQAQAGENLAVRGTYFIDRCFPDLVCLDITKPDALEAYLCGPPPDILVLLAGTKDVKLCEKHEEIAFMVNTQPTEYLIRIIESKGLNTRLICFSSDYVFAGDGGGYTPEDPTDPNTNYGRSKVAMEQALVASSVDYKVVRTAAVMGMGANFFDWFLRRVHEPGEISLFNNTVFSPTPQCLLNVMIHAILTEYDNIEDRILHLVGDQPCSRYDFATHLVRFLPKARATLVPEAADLNHSTFQRDLSLKPSSWLQEWSLPSFMDSLQKETMVWCRDHGKEVSIPILSVPTEAVASSTKDQKVNPISQ